MPTVNRKVHKNIKNPINTANTFMGGSQLSGQNKKSKGSNTANYSPGTPSAPQAMHKGKKGMHSSTMDHKKIY